MVDADTARSDFLSSNSVSGSDHNNVEVHAENAGGRIVLEAEIDVLGDAKAKAAGVGEVLLLQLVLLHLKATVKDLVGLEATDGDVDSNLLVSADAESSDSVAGYLFIYAEEKNKKLE